MLLLRYVCLGAIIREVVRFFIISIPAPKMHFSAFFLKVLPCVSSAKTEVPYAKQLSAQNQKMSGSSASGMSFKLLTAVMTNPFTFLLDVIYELLKRPKTAKGCLGGAGQKIIWDIFSFKVQSLWSKVQHICSPKNAPNLMQVFGAITLLQFQFRFTPPQAVMQLLKTQSAHGAMIYFGERTWSLHCFFLLHYVRGKAESEHQLA